MIRYLLYPPFLNVPEENSFEDEWEAFCLKLLKLEKQNNDIERRTPPEQGVDLFFKEKKIAYQCKSVTGTSGFNITKAVGSLKSALKIQTTLGWERYVVCSNVNLTGKQVPQLQEVYVNVDTKGKDYWVGLCEKFSSQVEKNFRILIEIPTTTVSSAINRLEQHYSNELKSKLEKDSLAILFYSKDHDKVYKMLVSLDFTIKDLKSITRSIFSIPKATFGQQGVVIVRDFFIIDGRKYDKEEKTLQEIGITTSSVLTYHLSFSYFTISGHEQPEDIMKTLRLGDLTSTDEYETIKSAKRNIKCCFENFDKSLE